MTRIELKLFDLSIDRIKESISHYITLYEKHFVYHVECHVEKQPDTSEGEFEAKDSYINYHALVLKSAITAIDVDYDGENEAYDCWIVEISVTGMATRIKIKCETQGEAEELYHKLREYIIS